MIFQVEGRVSNYLDKIYFLLTKDVEREWKIPKRYGINHVSQRWVLDSFAV